MSPAFERAVANEEVVLDVAHHAFVFAFGTCPVGSTSAWREPVMISQVEKTFVETGPTLVGSLEHGALLVIHQHFLGHAAEILETADQALVSVLSVQAVGAPEVEAPRVAQGVDDEIDLGGLASDLGGDLAPIGLQLLARSGFETDGDPAGPQRPFGLDVAPDESDPTDVTIGLDLPQDHHRIPDVFFEEPVDLRFVRI